jgi:hypothetical protein
VVFLKSKIDGLNFFLYETIYCAKKKKKVEVPLSLSRETWNCVVLSPHACLLLGSKVPKTGSKNLSQLGVSGFRHKLPRIRVQYDLN